MIGKLYTCIVEYYNTKEHRLAWKSRPILIIGEPRNNDYTVLPVSTISEKKIWTPSLMWKSIRRCIVRWD